MSLRVQNQLAFYQRRLPIYYRVRSICELLICLGTLASTALAFMHLEAWTPAAAAIVFTVTSWVEFSDVNKKLNRFSDTIQQIDTICNWWQSLSDVDRANVSRLFFVLSYKYDEVLKCTAEFASK